MKKTKAVDTVPALWLGPSRQRGSALAALGLLGAILARIVDRSMPKRGAKAQSKAPNRAAADALAAPASVSRG
jgi:hypothetical protein